MATNTTTLGTINTSWKSRTGAPKYGVSSQNGNASTTAFNIAHGLGGVPTSFSVVPLTEAAGAKRVVTATSTNIVVTYTTAPASGTGNVKLRWYAHRL